jgi:hypothetical protein
MKATLRDLFKMELVFIKAIGLMHISSCCLGCEPLVPLLLPLQASGMSRDRIITSWPEIEST